MEVNLELEAQVKALIKENKKVEAVALVQKVMVCGLVNAKRYVDSLNV